MTYEAFFQMIIAVTGVIGLYIEIKNSNKKK